MSAILGQAFYGTKTYGAQHLIDYKIDPFVATPEGYETIRVSWSSPRGDWDRLRLVRSLTGIAADENDGVVVVDATGATAEYVDNDLIGGRWYYYTLFLHDANGWQSIGYVSALAVADTGMRDLLWNRVPRYFQYQYTDLNQTVRMWEQTAEVLDPNGPWQVNTTLQKFLSVFGWGFDYLRNYTTTLLDANDPNRAHLENVYQLAKTLGVEQWEPTVPSSVMRSRVRNAGCLAATRGTFNGLRDLAYDTVGWDVDLQMGPNLFLTPDQSAFASPQYPEWSPNSNYYGPDGDGPGQRVVYPVHSSNGRLYNGLFETKLGGAYGTAQAPSASGGNNGFWTEITELSADEMRDHVTGQIGTWKAWRDDEVYNPSDGSVVPNSSFEDLDSTQATGVANWSIRQNLSTTTIQPSTVKANEGTRSLRVTQPKQSGLGVVRPAIHIDGKTIYTFTTKIASAPFPVIGKATYAASFDMCGTLSGSLMAQMEFYDADNTLLSSPYVSNASSGTALSTSAFSTFSGTVKVPETAVEAVFLIDLSLTTTSATDIYFDDVDVHPLGGTTSDLSLLLGVSAQQDVAYATSNALALTNDDTSAHDYTLWGAWDATSQTLGTPSALAAVQNGIPIPHVLTWDAKTEYWTNDYVSYQGIAYVARRANIGREPERFYNDWQKISLDDRLPLTFSYWMHAGYTTDVSLSTVPGVVFYDATGTYLSESRSTAGSGWSGADFSRIFDTFNSGHEFTFGNRDIDTATLISTTDKWSVRSGDWLATFDDDDEGIATSLGHGVVTLGMAPRTTYFVAVTFGKDSVRGAAAQALILNYQDSSNYIRVTRTAIQKVVSGTVESSVNLTTPAVDGDRVKVLVNESASTMKVFVNNETSTRATLSGTTTGVFNHGLSSN